MLRSGALTSPRPLGVSIHAPAPLSPGDADRHPLKPARLCALSAGGTIHAPAFAHCGRCHSLPLRFGAPTVTFRIHAPRCHGGDARRSMTRPRHRQSRFNPRPAVATETIAQPGRSRWASRWQRFQSTPRVATGRCASMPALLLPVSAALNTSTPGALPRRHDAQLCRLAGADRRVVSIHAPGVAATGRCAVRTPGDPCAGSTFQSTPRVAAGRCVDDSVSCWVADFNPRPDASCHGRCQRPPETAPGVGPIRPALPQGDGVVDDSVPAVRSRGFSPRPGAATGRCQEHAGRQRQGGFQSTPQLPRGRCRPAMTTSRCKEPVFNPRPRVATGRCVATSGAARSGKRFQPYAPRCHGAMPASAP